MCLQRWGVEVVPHPWARVREPQLQPARGPFGVMVPAFDAPGWLHDVEDACDIMRVV